MNRRVELGVAIGLMLLTGIASWWLLLRPAVEHDAAVFDALPTELNGWRSVDLAIDEAVSDMLAADHNVQRAYLHPLGYQIFVYVGYYGTERGGTPEHTPDICYPAQGWQIVESMIQRAGGQGGFDLREFVVEQAGERRLVHYWYRTGSQSGLTSVVGLRLRHVVDRMTENRGDGALVRLSTPLDSSNIASARTRLFSMDRVVEEALQGLWPNDSQSVAVSLGH